MIVQCEKCKTKFRIADEKLTDTGVKVRCSRCAHVFVVTTAGQVSAPPRGPDTARVDASALASLAASTQRSDPDLPSWNGFPPAATEQAAIPGLSSARANVPNPIPPPSATSSQQLAAALGFAGAPPPAPPPLPPTPGIPDFSEARTVQTKLQGLPKVPTDASLPSFPGPAAAPKTPSNPKPAPLAIPKAHTDPDPSVRFPPPPDLLASLAKEDGPELGGAATEMNLHGLGDDFGAGFPPPPPSSDLGAPPLDGPRPDLADDPFAGIDLDGPRSSPFHAAEGYDPNAGKSNAANEILARIDLGKAAVATDGSDPFGQLEATAHAVDAKPRVSARPRAATVPSLPQLEHRVRQWPTLAGVAFGVLFALFVYPGLAPDLARALELRSVDPVLSGPAATNLLPEGIGAVRAVEPIVTRYPADSTAGALVITGTAENTSTQAYTNLDVVVLVLDGEAIKERARAPLGVLLNPGVLSKINSQEELSNAWAAANAQAGQADRALAPGQERPFMVVFPRAVAGMEHQIFRVEFTPSVMTSDGR